MADNKPTSWEYSKNSPIGNYGTIVNGGSSITTITPNNPTGYSRLDPNSNDEIVKRIFYSIDINGKVTYAEGDSNGELRTRPDGTPIKQFNNIQEIANDRIPGYNNSTTLLLKNALSKKLKDRYKAIVIDKTDDASPYAKSGQNQPNNNGTDPEDTKLNVDIFDVSITPEGIKENYGSYAYPTDLGTNGQDFIQFSIKRYKPRNFNLTRSIGIIEERQQLDTVGTIALPIQPSISDSNNVDWNGIGLNPLEMELASGSLNIMSGQGQQYVNDLISRLETTIKDKNTIKAIKLYFAQKAAGTQGLLSRLGGGIVNPNLELLFQGPTLRPFTFTFRLSPREENEAREVRSIIRAFKEAMVVKTASQSFFLATPNIFDIKYVLRGQQNTDHPSLNKIKTCALKTCNVDYTPDGSYMTFNDSNATMTSYNLTLQFQELEPVTNQDYKDIPTDQIGY